MLSALKGAASRVKSSIPNPLKRVKKAVGNPAAALAAAKKAVGNPAAALAAAKKKVVASATALKIDPTKALAATALGGTALAAAAGVSSFNKISQGLTSFFSQYVQCLGVVNAPPGIQGWLMVFVAWIVTIGILIGILFALKVLPIKNTTAAAATTDASNRAAVLAAVKPVEKFVDAAQKPLEPQEYTLQNTQPLTIKQAAFLGPLPEGHFDTETGAVQALRAGFRSFIFQIDYLDKKRDDTKFASPGIPTLLYRADDGGLVSENSGDIRAVAQSIANSAFRPEVPRYTDPVIIYLHILRAPSVIRDADGYKNFLSTIAKALNPLAPNHLGMTPLGSFNRQKQEAVLLRTPLNTFEGQVIILCNADTTLFRNASPKINPADDLDFWVNARVYLNSSEDVIGITQMPLTGAVPSVVVVDLKNILTLSPQKMDAFAAQAKNQFVIAMPSQMANPTVDELDKAKNLLGVNMIPLDIFSHGLEEVTALVKEYDGNSFYPKPVGLRNTNSS